ncbi:FtsK/SpoIIIE domain-containing protein [Leucobacter soli]|uniref:FtsK/SpoIIIE domain-containing protein n=1 Tax=Leucobacter soli TaxID=2812850 RepID=UPI00360D2955
MRLKLSLLLPEGARNDILLSCDVTATVGELARALIRAGAAGNPELERAAGQRLMPVTLLGRAVGGESILLDPMSPITGSGLQSGWEIRPVAEFGTEDIAERRKIPRLIEDAGVIEVRSGAQRGVRFSLIAGRNLIGRDRACRIRLADRSVSRRHAEILFDPERGFVIRDLDSANGILIDGEPFRERAVSRRCELTLGDACLTLVPGPIPAPVPSLVHAVTHIRAPRVVPRFPSTERELPAPPAPKEAHRLPIVAVLAPLLIGTAMYAITRSPASLIMVVLSPVMMIGAWLDGVFGGRRRSGHETRRFGERLAAERERLDELRRLEIAVRAQEVPATAEVEAAIAGRGALLWTRRPEHRSFLEVRLGDGELRSRTRLVLPPHEDTAPAHRRELEALADRYRDVGPVPVTEHLDRCGCLGIAGRSRRAGGMARALILQLVGLHSPEDLVLACFAGSGHETEWSWLAWLPHVDPVGGPIPTGQLADSPERCTGLLQALEALADARAAHTRERRRTRSDLDAGAQGSTGPSDAAPGPPALPIVIVLVLDGHAADRSRLIALAEVGPDVGIHLVWVADDPTRLPAACRTFVAFDAPPPDGGVCGVGNPGEAASTVAEDCAEGAEAQVGFVRSGTVVPLARAESTEPSTAAELACGFASVEDAATRVLDESDLPRAVALPDLHDIDLLGGAEPIVQAWASSGSILADWRRGDERPTGSLAVVVGQGPAGPTTIDLRSHGPHALVGGTTGAGKSEFLQSWIMSLAASVSPDRIAFLLVDYKGALPSPNAWTCRTPSGWSPISIRTW